MLRHLLQYVCVILAQPNSYPGYYPNPGANGSYPSSAAPAAPYPPQPAAPYPTKPADPSAIGFGKYE